MSTTSRRSVTQPRATKASALRSSAQNTNTQKSSDIEPSTPKKSSTVAEKRHPHSNVRASEGVRAFMSSQRSRLNKVKEQQPNDTKPTTSGNVMTGAQRYTDDAHSASSGPNTANLKSVIQQAKSSGRLNLQHRHLETIPDQILNMYHVDPNSIVVDFGSSGGDAWYDAVELTKFVAAFNEITVMDERIGTEFGALTLLDFRNNRLQDLPSSLTQLQQLTTLQLPYNAFDTIPDVILQLTHLRELNLANNQLKQLPDNMGALDHLEILDLRNNMIGPDLPSSMQHLAALRKLSLDNNQLASLSSQVVSGWQKLDDLSLAHNRLTCFATGEQINLPCLLRLDIRQNNLQKLSSMQLPKLKELLLSGNALTTDLDYAFLQHCSHLLTLDVGSNQWSDIPNVVLELTQLQRLDIGGNQLRALPADLGRLTSLISLTWQGNPLRSVPRNITMSELIESLRVAQISQQDKPTNDSVSPVNDTPPDPQQQQQPEEPTTVTTRTLDLSNQKLTDLPDALLDPHDGVQILQLGNNELVSMSLMSCTRFSMTLVHLSLEKNKLSSFTLSVPDLTMPHLKTLNLASNRLRQLDHGDHSTFPALTELILNSNALTELPPLPTVHVLRCNSNRLAAIDPAGLGNVEVLDIGNNDIVTLPPTLGLIPSLRELTAYGNRFRVPQPSLLAQGTPAVMAFLKRRAGVATD